MCVWDRLNFKVKKKKKKKLNKFYADEKGNAIYHWVVYVYDEYIVISVGSCLGLVNHLFKNMTNKTRIVNYRFSVRTHHDLRIIENYISTTEEEPFGRKGYSLVIFMPILCLSIKSIDLVLIKCIELLCMLCTTRRWDSKCPFFQRIYYIL